MCESNPGSSNSVFAWAESYEILAPSSRSYHGSLFCREVGSGRVRDRFEAPGSGNARGRVIPSVGGSKYYFMCVCVTHLILIS